ncbi:MAG: PqiC family protein [Variovorax sp.]
MKTPILRKRRCAALMITALLAGLAGCAAAPTRYYTLAETAPIGPGGIVAPGAAALARAGPIVIELAPIAVPERLARPQLVVREAKGDAGAEISVLEQYRWTSSFENELRDALASGIARRLGAVDQTRGTRQSAQPAWRIAVQLRQFDAIENRGVEAALSWTARRSDQGSTASCQWSASESASAGIDALADAAQRVTARAAEVMARHIAALRTDPRAPCPR